MIVSDVLLLFANIKKLTNFIWKFIVIHILILISFRMMFLKIGLINSSRWFDSNWFPVEIL